PSKVQKQLGSDILRLWVSSVDYQADVRISNDILKQISEAYRKIRNTFRFLLANLADFNPNTDRIAEENLEEVDKYMLYRLQNLVENVRGNYDTYEFSPIFHQIHNFCAVDLSSFYLDFAKDVLYIEAKDNKRRRSIQTGYYEVLTTLVKLLTPIIPHTADELWEYIPGVDEESVQLTDIPEPRKISDMETIVPKWDHFMEIRDDVLKALEEARNEKVIGKSLEAKITLVPKEKKSKEVLQSMEHLHQYLIVSDADIVDNANETKEYKYIDIAVEKHPGEKCERCWVASETVGNDAEHPTLCSRCATVVKEHYTV
ncbi:class I tRNA ligase family protein, partial [Virgibacillus halodenitrificans]|nr:class I tRNA ligase family protein [Virgibacillus halodenitrificans]